MIYYQYMLYIKIIRLIGSSKLKKLFLDNGYYILIRYENQKRRTLTKFSDDSFIINEAFVFDKTSEKTINIGINSGKYKTISN